MEFYDPLENHCPWCGRSEPEPPGVKPPVTGWPKPMILSSLMKEQELPPFYEQETELEKEKERLQELFPETARTILPYVGEACDKLEYEGSPMFDEYPDKVTISRLVDQIYREVRSRYEPEEGDDKDETLAMNVETYRRYPPRKNWLSDLIEVLFVEEMFRRRCRRKNCRRFL